MVLGVWTSFPAGYHLPPRAAVTGGWSRAGGSRSAPAGAPVGAGLCIPAGMPPSIPGPADLGGLRAGRMRSDQKKTIQG